MVDIPSFFKKADFYGVLLPGYLAVTLAVVLFRPEILFSSTGGLSFDLFSAIVFLIFGPAIGLGLQQFHRRLGILAAWLRPGNRPAGNPGGTDPAHGRNPPAVAAPPPPPLGPLGHTKQFYEDYARVRLLASENEKVELDLAEAQYDFSMSAGIALVGIGLYHWRTLGGVDPWVTLLLIVSGVIFLVGGLAEWRYGYSPVMKHLISRYPL